MKRIFRNRRGATLILSLMMLASAGILIIALIGVTRMMMHESVFQQRAAQAQAIAEAGMEDALLQLRLASGWRTGFSNKSFAGGSYTVTLSTASSPLVTSVGSSPAIALFGAAHATVQATALINGTPPVCPNLSGASTMFLNASINAYDSSVSTNPTSFTFGSNACSNATIQVQPSQGYTVDGDVYYLQAPAPAQSYVVGVIHLSTFTRTVPFHDGSAYVSSNSNATGMSPTLYYTAITKQLVIPTGKSVTLAPGNYYFNTLTINSGATLIANNTAGSVTIYLNGSFNLNGIFSSASAIPSMLMIYPQGANAVNLQASSGAFYGIVEGPNAAIFTTEVVFGKLSGASMSLGAAFHYDVQTSSGSTTNHVAWQAGSWSSN